MIQHRNDIPGVQAEITRDILACDAALARLETLLADCSDYALTDCMERYVAREIYRMQIDEKILPSYRDSVNAGIEGRATNRVAQHFVGLEIDRRVVRWARSERREIDAGWVER